MAVGDNQLDRIAAELARLPANDSIDVWDRLADYAQRGMDAPEGLTLHQIRQVSYALSLLLTASEKHS